MTISLLIKAKKNIHKSKTCILRVGFCSMFISGYKIHCQHTYGKNLIRVIFTNNLLWPLCVESAAESAEDLLYTEPPLTAPNHFTLPPATVLSQHLPIINLRKHFTIFLCLPKRHMDTYTCMLINIVSQRKFAYFKINSKSTAVPNRQQCLQQFSFQSIQFNTSNKVMCKLN